MLLPLLFEGMACRFAREAGPAGVHVAVMRAKTMRACKLPVTSEDELAALLE